MLTSMVTKLKYLIAESNSNVIIIPTFYEKREDVS